MSQKCLVSFRKHVTEEDGLYDCIYDENGCLVKLLEDWLCLSNGSCIGPWKLNIRDKELFERFNEDFLKLKDFCSALSAYEDIWTIYIDGALVHQNERITERMMGLLKNFMEDS